MGGAWGYVAFGLLMALPISLALGRGWLRQLALVLAGFALVGVLYVYALAAGCSPDAHECFPELALLLGGFVLVGWLAGIGLAALVRFVRRRRPGPRNTLLVAGTVLLVALGVTYGR